MCMYRRCTSNTIYEKILINVVVKDKVFPPNINLILVQITFFNP